jgi:hypothetical protein
MNAPGRFGGGPRALRRLANQTPQDVEPMHVGEHWSAPPPHRADHQQPSQPWGAGEAIYGFILLLFLLVFSAAWIAS